MRFFALPLAAILLCAHPSAAQRATANRSTSPSALDKKAFEDYVRHLFAWGPQIQVQVAEPKPSTLAGFKEVGITASAGNASQQETFLVSNDGRKIIRGIVYDIAENPFGADAAKLKTDRQPSFGPEGAPVTIVMYSDFQCSYCREEAKVIRQNLIKEFSDGVRLYFKDFPLEPIHPWAKRAAMAGRCIFNQKPLAFWDYHDWIFEHQGEITVENLKEKVQDHVKAKGLDSAALATCLDTKATEADVSTSMAEARSVGVNSTPTMFVNGRRLVGQHSWPQLKQVIEHEIEYQKKHAGAEKCCELKLPAPAR